MRLTAAVHTRYTAPEEELRVSCIQQALNNGIDPRGSDEDLLTLCAIVSEEQR